MDRSAHARQQYHASAPRHPKDAGVGVEEDGGGILYCCEGTHDREPEARDYGFLCARHGDEGARTFMSWMSGIATPCAGAEAGAWPEERPRQKHCRTCSNGLRSCTSYRRMAMPLTADHSTADCGPGRALHTSSVMWCLHNLHFLIICVRFLIGNICFVMITYIDVGRPNCISYINHQRKYPPLSSFFRSHACCNILPPS